jgi:hypothetical protein
LAKSFVSAFQTGLIVADPLAKLYLKIKDRRTYI